MKQDYTHIEVIVDKSGSMARTATDTIGSINTFVSKQKEVPGTASFRLTQFNHHVYPGPFYSSLADVPALTTENYQAGGNTSLLDAVGETINSLGSRLASMPDSERPSKVIVVILTDGEENAIYPKFTREQIFEMISHQKNKYNWSFMFLAANQDAIKVGTKLGVSRGATLNYAQSSTGLESMGMAVNRAIGTYRRGGQHVNSTKAIFTPDEIKAAIGVDTETPFSTDSAAYAPEKK